jgi:hypothetical protein
MYFVGDLGISIYYICSGVMHAGAATGIGVMHAGAARGIGNARQRRQGILSIFCWGLGPQYFVQV